jgi:capsule polysaccharide export protein KpsE/RkpR
METNTNVILIEEPKQRPASAKVEKMQGYLAAAKYLWDHRGRWLLWTLAGTALSALLTIRMCKFEGTVQIMPPDAPGSGGSMASMALPMLMKSPALSSLSGMASDMLGVKSTGSLFAKVMQSRTVEDNLIDHYQLRERYGKKYWEDARKILQNSTTVTEDKKSGVISVVVRDRDPKLASDLAAAYIKELDQLISRTSTSAAGRERAFIEQRLKEEKAALDESQQRFSQFSSNSMALDIPQQTRVMVESAARLQGEMIASRAELQGLEQIYTAENPRVRTLRSRVNELQRAMDQLNGASTGKPAAKDGTSSPYPSVKKLPIVGLEWTNLYRDAKIHETIYETLTQQFEMARIQEARELPTVKLLDQAVVPEKRHPSPKLVTAIGALLSGLLACVGLLWQYNWLKRSPDDPWRMLLATAFRKEKDVSSI